ncbi:50S ribosomal protein L11 methyltransferase [Solilutibacter silvestris]|uniref:Ribosomal protein L11 methyltransferase n=1 Tax=Solilutibacter silvestris TaxID=1645665 RepID=A0A2K1Q1Z8_9GAMM|nr:50S ribosomal protein L11 methyltransferase [Lysobacter silvestris]PNS09065.1 prmA: ribosomal protein L11 methyltransferase [Lysobacter silvestris]
MPWLELTLPCTLAEQARCERALEDLGALSVTMQDADAETADEQAIFEPGVGETPLWKQMVLTALFEADIDALALLAALESFDPDLHWDQAAFRKVEDQDWERAWLDQFKPMRFGARTWVVPWNLDVPADAGADAAIIRLDPGLAFGSGTHPTTALCLEWLDDLAARGLLQGRDVLDFGSGSGILALAAIKLGAARADGIDNDPQAIIATHDNAERNGVASQLRAVLPDQASPRRYPVVVANILASALDALAETLVSHCEPGTRIALSGILAGQEDELLQRYATWFDELKATRQDDWMRIDGVRRAG